MIVSPDFPDHWKTRHVVRQTGAEAAVRCILRLWGHCQQRRRWVFPELTAEVLASICGWENEPAILWAAMVGTFLDSTDAGIEVHDWATVNASLISNWQKGQYGSQGGRPRKNPQGFPKVEDKNLGLTLSKPDKIREDKIREDKRREEVSGAEAPSSSAVADDAKAMIPCTQVFDLFELTCPSHPKLKDRNEQRKEAIRARWKTVLKAGREPLAWFTELFTAAEASDFIAGRKDRAAFGFDWIIKPANAAKLLEGNYTNSRDAASVNGHGQSNGHRPAAVDMSKATGPF